MKFIFIFALFVTITCTEGAKILGIFHFPSYSHFQLGDILVKELARRGHEITVITPYEDKAPVKNVKTVVLTGAAEEMEKHKVNIFKFVDIPAIVAFLFLVPMVQTITESTLTHPNVQKLLKSDEKFDLVITELILNEAFHGFSYKYDAPCITISSVATNVWLNAQSGNPNFPSYIPETVTGFSSDMNFLQRVYNTFAYMLQVFLFEINMPTQNKLLQKYFPGAPHVNELYYNTSLVLLNSNAGLNNPVPLVPNMIEIGGFHIKNLKKLPDDLQKYLDSAKDGAIFFSMGSNIKSSDMDAEKCAGILRAFSKFKNLKVLWKWEDENLPNKPENVKISKWLPQQEILAHPNVKLFISHGGFFSTIETVYFGVPVIGIPIVGDQKTNIGNAENAGYAIKLDYKDLNEESLTQAISKILTDTKYTENVKTRSKILQDQPVKPLDKAMFWIEYVLRHKGAPHLRTAALSLKWYQYFLLDVIALTALVLCVTFYIVFKLIKKICGCKTAKGNVTQSKKKN